LRSYELIVVISPEVSEEELATSIERVNQFITAGGGDIIDLKQWGRRKLAYPIRHFREGYYVQTQFNLGSELTTGLEANLRISEDVLRHLLVRLDE
jgi:small subunit ribosomal protein S6